MFSNGYWDYRLDRRGMLFAPVYFSTAIYRRPGFVYTPSVVIDAALATFSFFVRPDYAHYYFGDYCAAQYDRLGIYPWFRFPQVSRLSVRSAADLLRLAQPDHRPQLAEETFRVGTLTIGPIPIMPAARSGIGAAACGGGGHQGRSPVLEHGGHTGRLASRARRLHGPGHADGGTAGPVPREPTADAAIRHRGARMEAGGMARATAIRAPVTLQLPAVARTLAQRTPRRFEGSVREAMKPIVPPNPTRRPGETPREARRPAATGQSPEAAAEDAGCARNGPGSGNRKRRRGQPRKSEPRSGANQRSPAGLRKTAEDARTGEAPRD